MNRSLSIIFPAATASENFEKGTGGFSKRVTELSGHCFTSFNTQKNLPCAAPSNIFPSGVDLLVVLYSRKNLVVVSSWEVQSEQERGNARQTQNPPKGQEKPNYFSRAHVEGSHKLSELGWRGPEQLHFSPFCIFHSILECEDKLDPPARLLLLLPTTNQY